MFYGLIRWQFGEQFDQFELGFLGRCFRLRRHRPIMPNDAEEEAQEERRRRFEVAAFDMPCRKNAMQATGFGVTSVHEQLLRVIGFVEVFGAVELAFDDQRIPIDTVLDDAEVHFREAHFATNQTSKLRDAGNRPFISPLNSDVVLNHRRSELLVDLIEPLTDVIDIPAQFSGMNEPVEHGLAFFIAKGATIKKRACLIEHDNAVVVLRNAVLPSTQRLEIISRWTVGQTRERCAIVRWHEFGEMNIQIRRDTLTGAQGVAYEADGEKAFTGTFAARNCVVGHLR